MHRPRRDAAQVRRHPVRPQRRRASSAASSACAGDVVELWPAYEEIGYRIELFGDEVETLAVIDPLTGTVLETTAGDVRLPGQALRPARGADQGGRRRDPGGAGASGSSSSRSRASCSKPSGWPPGPATTWRCCWRSATARGSRTTAGPSRAASRARRRTRCSTSSPTTACCSSTSRTSPSPRSAACSPATSAARARWSSTASACPSALDNRPLRFDEWENEARPADLRLGHARRLRGQRCPAARSSSRSSGRPAWSTRSSGSSPPAGRCPHLLERDQEAGRRRASGCWSPP